MKQIYILIFFLLMTGLVLANNRINIANLYII